MQFWKFFFPTIVIMALLIMIVTNLVFQDIYTSKYASLYNIAFDKKLKSQNKYQEFNSSILSDQNINIKEKNIGAKKKIAYIFAGSARSFVCDKVIYVNLSKYCWYVI